MGVIAVVILLLVGFSLAIFPSLSSGGGEYKEFAQCLTDNGVKMYGAFWCPHCNNQKAMFGSSWKHINYVECSNPDRSQTPECSNAGITGYPTWEFGDGSRQSGEMTVSQLSQKSGCSISS